MSSLFFLWNILMIYYSAELTTIQIFQSYPEKQKNAPNVIWKIWSSCITDIITKKFVWLLKIIIMKNIFKSWQLLYTERHLCLLIKAMCWLIWSNLKFSVNVVFHLVNTFYSFKVEENVTSKRKRKRSHGSRSGEENEESSESESEAESVPPGWYFFSSFVNVNSIVTIWLSPVSVALKFVCMYFTSTCLRIEWITDWKGHQLFISIQGGCSGFLF